MRLVSGRFYSAAKAGAKNVLKNAPHTADCIINKNWNYPYTPQEAVYPVAYLKEFKYWVPVRRVDNAFGDRNLVCSCPSVEDYK